MTPTVRRRVFLSVLVLALTLPTEIVLLNALQTPDDKTAAQQWAAELDDASLTAAADRIETYPFVYRREIMAALSPDARAAAWRAHLDRYQAARGALDESAVIALKETRAALTPTALSDKASPEEIAALDAAAKAIEVALGKEAAMYIAHDLGPRTISRLASAEPLVLKLASFVRGHVVALARADECDCADDGACGYYLAYCSTSSGCDRDDSWPMCGYWWNTTCNGLCELF